MSYTVPVALRLALPGVCAAALLLATPGTLRARQATLPGDSTAYDRVFARLYNVDFNGAHVLLNERARVDPADPLVYSVRAVAYTFSELQRLNILETEFFVDDQKVTSETPLRPDPETRGRIFASLDEARRRAHARLQLSPNDRDAIFALCMSADVLTDYTALVERRQLSGLLQAREMQTYAQRLIALTPPVYDAYQAMGALEYINSRVPFFVRWFVRFRDIEGSERKAIEYLQIVVDRGRYYAPFAKVLLAVLHLRGNRPIEARNLLADLARQFPENPLFPKELARANLRMAALR